MAGLPKNILLAFFLFVFSTTIFFASGVIESVDEWLYISVTRNLYYHHTFNAAPKEYTERKNIYFNSLMRDDGSWYSPAASGYSVAMLPAAFLSDAYHRVTQLPVSQHFPLETDWSLHLFASFTHVFWGAVLATITLVFIKTLGISDTRSLLIAGGVFFLSNLFPLSNHSYPHIFQTSIYMAIFTCLALHAKFQVKSYLLLAVILLIGVLPFAYNVSFLLLIPGLVSYFLMKNDLLNLKPDSLKKMGLVMVLLTLMVVFSIYWFHLWPIVVDLVLNFKPTILFEGVWGLLFSAGKSVFIYNPILLILVVFWWKIPKKYTPELVAFLITSALFLFFYGQSIMMDRLVIVPIWAGGNNWGLRYLAPLLPLGMTLAFLTARHLSKIHTLVIFYPLLAMAAFVQMVGVSLPYDLQYGSLPYTVDIFDGYHDRYNYGSHIPRFSPLITQTKFFFKRLIELPATLHNYPFNTRLYDGFAVPTYLDLGLVRPFGEGGGYVEFEYPTQKKITISANLIGILDSNYATPSASIMVNGTPVEENIHLEHTQLTTVAVEAEVHSGKNEITFLMECDTTCGIQTIWLQELKIDDQKVNLGSIDLPYVDHGTEHWPERKYYGSQSDYWVLWGLRHNVFASTLDFWWLRYLYYWDLPQAFIIAMLVGNSLIFYCSALYLYQRIKKV